LHKKKQVLKINFNTVACVRILRFEIQVVKVFLYKEVVAITTIKITYLIYAKLAVKVYYTLHDLKYVNFGFS